MTAQADPEHAITCMSMMPQHAVVDSIMHMIIAFAP